MNSIRKHILFFILYFLFVASGYGQQKIYFDRIEKENGQQLGHIFDLFEDTHGFVWFCTHEGLIKYDGFQFKYYLHDKNDENSLSSSWIFSGIEDSKGRFWIGTSNGLNLMDRTTEKYQRFFHNPDDSTSLIHNEIREVFEDSQHRIWVGTLKGFCLFNEENQTFQRVNSPEFEGARHTPKIFEDSQGRLWATSINGLYLLDPDQLTTQRIIINKDKENPEISLFVRGLGEDINGDILLGTNKGVWRLNPETFAYSILPLPKDIRDKSFGPMLEYPQGFMMLGSFSVGLISWDMQKRQIHRRFTRHPTDMEGMVVNSTYSLALDELQNLWIGTFSGVNKLNLNANKFQVFRNKPGSEDLENYILRSNEDESGRIWTTSMRGIFVRENIFASPKPFVIPPWKLSNHYGVRYFNSDKNGKLWIGLRYHGLCKIDLATNSLDTLINVYGNDNKNYYSVVKQDEKKPNLLWITAPDGLIKFNKITAQKTWYVPMKDSIGLTSNVLREFVEDEEGNLWILAKGGVVKFDKKTAQFSFFQQDSKKPEAILSGGISGLVFSKTGLWIASGDGLSFLENGAKFFQQYPSNDTLFHHGIAGLQVADNGDVWIADENGLSRFDPITKSFESYYYANKTDGFINGSGAKGQDGRLYFGTPKGLLSFHPDSVFLDTIVPKVVLTNVIINNETRNFDRAVELMDTIFLYPDDKIFTLQYAGLQFNNSKQNCYKVRLKGYEKEWREMGTKREASYSKMSPGEYTFQVLSANADDIWMKKPYELSIIVIPEFWQTGWFSVLVTVLISSIFYLIYKNYQHTRKLAADKAVAEKTAEYRSLFLSNMSHEIRTPMNAIVGMSQLILETDLNKKQIEYTKIVHQSAENLLIIINDILDQSKIESGHYSFVKKPFELDLLLQQLSNIFAYRVREKGLGFDLQIAPSVTLKLIGDANRLNQILVNLIGNAIKFTHQGNITVSVKPIAEKANSVTLRFSVTDTGIGIASDQLKHVFDSFKQIKNEQYLEEKGSGLGLSISKQLVEEQGGKIGLKSKWNKGSTFYFTLTFEKNVAELTAKNKVIEQIPVLQELTFLLVEDTLFNQMLAVELLKKSFPNAEVDVANNGQIALEKIRQKDYDLVLMDVKMPIMDGLEATRLIRKMKAPEKQNVPILAVTATAIPTELQRCHTAGMNDYVVKPIDRNDLFTKIKNQLEIE